MGHDSEAMQMNGTLHDLRGTPSPVPLKSTALAQERAFPLGLTFSRAVQTAADRSGAIAFNERAGCRGGRTNEELKERVRDS